MKRKKLFPFIVAFLFSTVAFSKNNTGGSKQQIKNEDEALVGEAVKDTEDLLRNSERRNEVIKADPKAKSANDKVKAVTGGDDISTQKIYSISADILPYLMKEAQNNPDKAEELLKNAQRNPAAFLNSLPADIRNKIQDVSAEIERKNSSGAAP